MTFTLYLARFVRRESARGDLARDWIEDRGRPDVRTLDQLESYLRARGACTEALDAARKAWRGYQRAKVAL